MSKWNHRAARYRHSTATLFLSLGVLLQADVHADGMVPRTSVVIVDEKLGEASIAVTNTDAKLALLHVSIENVPEDTEELLVVTPEISRVEPGQQQLVRFMLDTSQPLKTQRLKRVLFEGIEAQKKEKGTKASIGISVRQNLPVIINPAGLKREDQPWKGLTWSIADGKLKLRNDTPYVVRMAQDVTLLPSNKPAHFSRTYVLPGEALDAPLPDGETGDSAVRIFPATVYGFAVDHYDATIQPAKA